MGMALARLAYLSGVYCIGGVYNRTYQSSSAAVAFIGSGEPCATLLSLPPAALTLVAVPDALISEVAGALSKTTYLQRGDIVFHTSGAGAAALLSPLTPLGVATASVHPAFSFADPGLAVSKFKGTYCAVEAEDSALQRLIRFVTDIGGQALTLNCQGKASYHAALTIASNYAVALAHMASRTMAESGIDDAGGQQLVMQLMQQTLANVKALGPEKALTGPILRGDVETLKQHLAVLDDTQTKQCYHALGLSTLALARPRLSRVQYAALFECLKG